MAAANLSISIEQGATFTRSIVYNDSEGNPVDLTSVTAVRGQVRDNFASPTAYDFTLAVESPPTSGVISWLMPADVTATFPVTRAQKYFYDIEIEYSSGVVERLLEGIATITPEVTR